MAEWWVSQADDKTQRSLLRAALGVESGVALANDIHTVFNKSSSPTERITTLTKIFNRSGHAVSERVTRAAISGVATAGTAAIDEVSKAITQFPSSRAGIVSRARMEHQLAVARESAGGAAQANRANLEALRAGFSREIDEQLRAVEAERRALAEERAQREREYQERLAAWHRQQAYAHAMEEQRRYNEYLNWVQARNIMTACARDRILWEHFAGMPARAN
jgi:Skp family chaperone for outer membrane proteins